MHKLFTHVVHSGKVIKITCPCTYTTINEREREAYLEAGTKTMTKAWWLVVPPVRSSLLYFWVFLIDEGMKMMMMPVLSGN